jgi:hypothetical protein
VEHASVAALAWKPNYATVSIGDTIGHASNVAFDATTFEVWASLLNGARLAILQRDDLLSPAALMRAIDAHGITCLFLTTALFNAIARANPHAFGALRHLLFGGEAHDPACVRDVLLATPPGRLVNAYGPTETTTFATFHAVRADEAGNAIPIGGPVSGAELFIVDGQGELVPPGVVGELWIGGKGVARGYLNRPEQTAERFIMRSLRGDAASRVFRSGDLARWNADGAVEYVGRNDLQVKIRGFRIEPAEVAAVVGTHPAVRECHVVARRQASGDVGLTAYFVPANPASPVTPSALHRHVATRLPSFMMPVSWISVDAFHLTRNGKLDDRMLPEPTRDAVAETVAYAPPRDPTERALCRIWAEVLGVGRIGIDDDFFSAGGHSLLAARVFSRIDAELRRSLPLGALFEFPTVRQLAKRLRACAAAPSSCLVAITRGGTLPPVHVVPGVFGNVIGFADLGRALGPAQPLYGLQSVGLDGADEPFQSIEAMARHYLGAIGKVQPRGPYALIGSCFGATVAYEMARQLLMRGETVAYLGLLDPTLRGGSAADRRPRMLAGPVARMLVGASFARDRMRLYRAEMRELRGATRFAYVLGKSASMLRRVGNPAARDVRRELNERRVYRCNVAALDGYRRLPLQGDLRLLAIIETARPTRSLRSDGERWQRWWHGPIVRCTAPGDDSGDMISGANAAHVAALVSQHLRMAFAAGESMPERPVERDRSLVT